MMARIAGVDLPDQKRVDIGLTYIYGIGRSNVSLLLGAAKIDGTKRVKELSEEEVSRIQKALDKFTVEGDLQREISQNVRRLEEIGAYRGSRHKKGLPSRGQRTRSNGRTQRGKRKTVGTISKNIKTPAPAAK